MDDIKEMQKKIAELSKQYHSIGEVDFTRSGSVVLDAILGGGIPKGVFILWSAENGCGKSTGSLHISRVYCMQGKRVLYLDYEGGVNTSQIDGMGLTDFLYDQVKNPNGPFILFQVQTYKDAEKILDTLMTDVDLVVIDSATAMLTEKVKGSSSEDALPGVDSRVMSNFLKKYKAEAVRHGVTWIIINQMRTKISFMGATGDVEAGGNALKFYPDIRLQMKKAFKGSLEREEETATGKQKVPFGAICTIWATKNRYERPGIPLNLAIIFGILQNVIASVNFNVFILDELFSNMDADTRNIMLTLLNESMDRNNSIFVINHAEMQDDYFKHKIRVTLQNKKIISASKKAGEDIIVKASKYELINF